jgi:glucose/arabinose dehydrogenase
MKGGNSALSLSDIFALVVSLVGGAALLSRRLADGAPDPAWGNTPLIPTGKPQGRIPTLKMPTAQGWSQGQTPTAALGLRVNAFASGLDHPRWLEVLAQWGCTRC